MPPVCRGGGIIVGGTPLPIGEYAIGVKILPADVKLPPSVVMKFFGVLVKVPIGATTIYDGVI